MIIKDLYYTGKAACRAFKVTTPRLLWTFIWNFGMRNIKNMAAFEKRLAKGDPFFPAFVMISLTETCNLGCSGCWVSQGGRKTLTNEQLDGIIRQSKARGSYFFGILGGEPLLYKGLFDVLAKHPDCYFQLFTNGTLLTDEIARKMRQLGNITPLISIEGLEEESDHRRQRDHVYNRTLEGVRACRRAKLIFGAAASICKSNFNDLVSRSYIDAIAREGALYLWYYIYRPVGAEPNPDNCLTKEDIHNLRKFLVDQRDDAPLFLIDTYWDDKGQAMCPGASGMSHHISPAGAVEFCPPLQLSKERLNADASNLGEIFSSSEFLANMRKFAAERTRGCIIMEDPAAMRDFLKRACTEDSTTRGTVSQEYDAMDVVPGHDMKEDLIPERNVVYKFLKKRYFFGFGAYG